MLKFAANLSWLFQEYPALERFEAARRLGFKAVEFPLLYDHAADALGERRAAAGLEFLLINSPPGDMDGGEYGLACLPGREAEFQDTIGVALDYARALSSRFIHVLAGIVPDGMAAERCCELYLENLAWAARMCAEAGVGVLVEPINTFERSGYFLSLTGQARAAIEQVGGANVTIQFDIHNAQLMEGYLTRLLTEHIDLIGHIQIAGVPGRTPPDVGEINYPYLFALIERLGYDGWIGCEYRAPDGVETGSTEASLAWAKGCLGSS